MMYFDQMSELAKRVTEAVEAAKENGYPVSKIATVCSVSRQAVYQWINGETKSIDASNLVELAEISGYNARWIATGKGQKKGTITMDEMTVVKGFRLFGEEIRQYWLDAARKKIAEDAESKKGQAA